MNPVSSVVVKESAGVAVSTRYQGVDTDRLLRDTVGASINRAVAAHITPLDISSAWRITSRYPGPAVTIFGGVHGFETCGVDTVVQLLRQFASGELALTRGSLTLAIGNEEAVKACERKMVSNLNRLFHDSTVANEQQGLYESGRAADLCRLIRQSHYFLDLHSTSAPARPFGIVSPGQIELAGRLGLDRVLVMPEEWRTGIMAGTAGVYADDQGTPGNPCYAITVENGQHADPQSAAAAYEIARRFLAIAGVLVGDAKPVDQILAVVPEKTVMKVGERFQYSRPFANFDFVRAGELIGKDLVGEYRAEQDGCILLPTPEAQSRVGEELYFLGKATVMRHRAA